VKLTRFERKIVAAIAAVAIVPLVGSLVLGRLALEDTYEVGVNPRVQGQLENALELYRAHFVALRDDAERTADAVAFDYRIHQALLEGDDAALTATLERALERYPNVAGVAVLGPDGIARARIHDSERSDPDQNRLLEQSRPLLDLPGEPTIEVTIATPAAPFLEYQQAGEVVEVFGRLAEGADYVTLYHSVYIGFLLSVIVVAMAVGIILSRRVTRRVADLAEATARVGGGDLSVQIPSDAGDEVGELTRAFNDMVRDLRESRERIDYLSRIGAWQDFARRLAHEIKNPLTPIQLAAQEVHRAYGGEDEDYRRKLEDARGIIEEEVATLRRLVGEFSAFAKLPQAELSPADLGDFVSDVEKSLEGIPEGEAVHEEDPKPVEIRCDPGPDPLPVRIDAMMLKRCVDNLVRNAVQAVRRGGEAGGQVVVVSRREGGRAVLEVSDDGPGVRPENHARVFDPYYTTRGEGTGLGLAIVKKVVLEHGGEIECGEAPGGGAVFRIRLPLSAETGSSA